jgi:hypothetical protein
LTTVELFYSALEEECLADEAGGMIPISNYLLSPSISIISHLGAVRFAYNKALPIKKHAYKQHGVSLSPRKALKPLLAVAKKSRKYAWLKEYNSIAL